MSPKVEFIETQQFDSREDRQVWPPQNPFSPLSPLQVKHSCPSGGLEAGNEKEGGNPISVQLFPPELVSLWGLVRIVNAGLRGSL